MKYNLALILAIFICFECIAQNAFRGSVVNTENDEQIQYANIFYKNNQRIGTLSERDGKFVLRKIDNADNDTLVFSILGYETKYIPVSSIKDEVLNVELQFQAIQLDEVAIVDHSYLKKLLIKAVENIPNNYPNQKHRLTGYFQEQSITQGEYSHFLESYLTVENEDYAKDLKLLRNEKTGNKYPWVDNKVWYHQIRKSNDTRYLPDRFEKWLGGSIHETLFNNFIYGKRLVSWSTNHTHQDLVYDIKHLESEKIQTEDSEQKTGVYQKLYKIGEHYQGTDTLITIGLEHSFFAIGGDENKDDFSFDVKQLVINKSNYAIERIIDTISDKLKEKWNSTLANNFYKEIQFRQVNGKYYPSLIINKIGVDYNLETRQEINTTRFLVQEIQTSKDEFLKIKPSKKLKRGQRLVEKKYKYDPEFWKQYEIPKQMEASLALKADLSRQVPLEVQFKLNEKKKN